MLGDWASMLTVTLFQDYNGLLFAILPPGAFMSLAVIIAMKNKIDSIKSARVELSSNVVEVTLEPGKA